MKTKIIIPGLLAALMLVIVPVITVAVTNTNEQNNIVKETIPPVETTKEETVAKETISLQEINTKEITEEETTMKNTKYYHIGFITATFSGVNDKDFDLNKGLLLTKNIVITSTDGSLTSSLKINGKTIIESGKPVKLKINLMTCVGVKLWLTSMIAGSSRYHLGVSGVALGITVTY
jgi:hypothetical protein